MNKGEVDNTNTGVGYFWKNINIAMRISGFVLAY
jgi:hypothetical protein